MQFQQPFHHQPQRTILPNTWILPPDGWVVAEEFPPENCTWCGWPTVSIDTDMFGCVDCDRLDLMPYAGVV